MTNYTILLAYLTDFFVGDPARLPHPVVLFGKLVNKLEQYLLKDNASDRSKLINGGILVALVMIATYILSFTLLYTLYFWQPWLGHLATIWLISTTISARGLQKAGLEIQKLLINKNIREARQKVSYIVGRDTEKLNSREITRATIETIAENIVDGITAPLFYAFVGGAPLALTYRAVNTMDSMLGYKNEKYLYFGRIAARIDDVFNYLPSRLTGLSIVVVSQFIPGFSGQQARKVFFRDRNKHLSPNSGQSESAVSGALRIRLGGVSYYQGHRTVRPYMGDALRGLDSILIGQTTKLMWATATFWVVILTLINIGKSYF